MMLTVFVAFGSYVCGLFGMNIHLNAYDFDTPGYPWVSVVGALVGFILMGSSAVYLHFRWNGTFPPIFDRYYLSKE
jgi:hypothetical protein